MKIAILIRAETAERCSGLGCFKALNARADSFAVYADDEEIELCGYFHNGGDLDYKIEKMKDAGVQVIHLATCIRGKYDDYAALADRLSADFDVIGYTHGGAHGRSRRSVHRVGKYLCAADLDQLQ